MSQVSKYPVSKDVYEQIFSTLLKTTANLKTRKEVAEFFEEFLSPTERIMLAKRLAIGLLLAKDYDYKEISKVLRVSTGTISGVSVIFRYGKAYKKTVKKLLEDEKIEEFWLSIGEKVAGALSHAGAKGSGWVYLRDGLKKKKLKRPF